jgi:hypothetical protein
MVGHTIHFKGAKNTDNTVNLHSCSCYWLFTTYFCFLKIFF